MQKSEAYPQDFKECIEFHGHVCPGLAIGYAAVKAGKNALNLKASEDEEIVAVVENDSCAVDAVQELLGCTFGKGNLIFRDWGKQVYTFFDRNTGKAVRVALKGETPLRSEMRKLREKIDSNMATPEEIAEFKRLRNKSINLLINSDPADIFEIKEIDSKAPAEAQIVQTRACSICGEHTMVNRMVRRGNDLICKQCAGEIS
ncbi:MAG: FmdE family protein [Desulfomonilaceae bacterium]